MKAAEARTRIQLKNILYLTDFSEPSAAALSFAASIAREYESTIRAFHVLVPVMYPYTPVELVDAAAAMQEECVKRSMQWLAAQLTGLPHNTVVERGAGVWRTVERALKEYHIDLIVLGTHGRTGAGKLLLGSVAEEVFRRSRVPVLTIGPWFMRIHTPMRTSNGFCSPRISHPSHIVAVRYAIALAEEHQAQLILLHIIPERPTDIAGKQNEDNVANARYELERVVPSDAVWWWQPDTVVEYGEPAERILEIAKQLGADLIVLGVRDRS